MTDTEITGAKMTLCQNDRNQINSAPKSPEPEYYDAGRISK